MNDRAAWLTERKTGIGGSDAAAIMGLSPYRTPLAVYLDKRGESEETSDNPSMLWGRLLEPVVREHYAQVTGRSVLQPTEMLRSPAHDFMVANLDGFTEDRRIVEIKTARTSGDWGEEGSDQVPDAYMMQVQHYMAVTGFPVADIAVLIGGSDFRLYEVPADAELQEAMIEAEAEFWQRVQTGTPPDPVSQADMKTRFGAGVAGSTIEANESLLAAISVLRDARNQLDFAKADEANALAAVQQLMGTTETVTSHGKTLVTWKTGKPVNRFDTTAFKTAHAELYQQFTKAGDAVRRFILKEEK